MRGITVLLLVAAALTQVYVLLGDETATGRDILRDVALLLFMMGAVTGVGA